MKFKVGEICLAMLGNGRYVECEVKLAGIISTKSHGGGTVMKEYGIEVPSFPRAGNGLWGCNEADLKKKKPPEQKDIQQAEDWFKRDLQRLVKGYVYE